MGMETLLLHPALCVHINLGALSSYGLWPGTNMQLCKPVPLLYFTPPPPFAGALPAYVHGAHLVLLDGLGLGVGLPPSIASALRHQCCLFLRQQLPAGPVQLHATLAEGNTGAAGAVEAADTAAVGAGARGQEGAEDQGWGIYPFFVPRQQQSGAITADQGVLDRATPGAAFELAAPTAARNAFRVLRALSLHKAVLLEGSPGVGKTALVAALAQRAGVKLVSEGCIWGRATVCKRVKIWYHKPAIGRRQCILIVTVLTADQDPAFFL